MATAQGLAMSWAEWAGHDATSLAALVKSGAVTPAELAAQCAAAVGMLDGRLNAVLGLFDDAIANPDTDGPAKDGRLYGVPMFLKDLGAGLKGRLQESGSRMFKGNIAGVTDPKSHPIPAADSCVVVDIKKVVEMKEAAS